MAMGQELKTNAHIENPIWIYIVSKRWYTCQVTLDNSGSPTDFQYGLPEKSRVTWLVCVGNVGIEMSGFQNQSYNVLLRSRLVIINWRTWLQYLEHSFCSLPGIVA